MKRMGRFWLFLIVISMAVQANASVTIIGDVFNSTENLGDFQGELTYNWVSAGSATLALLLTNTSPAANGGYLTAFVFNNPFNLVSEVVLTASDADFNLLGAASLFDNGVKASPFGWFDIGASTGGGFAGQNGGNPNKGLPVGETALFSFALTGSSLDTLDEDSFVSELSNNPGGGGPQFFVARFRGFNNNGSDKVPATPVAPVPEPTTLILLGSGMVGLIGWKKITSTHQ